MEACPPPPQPLPKLMGQLVCGDFSDDCIRSRPWQHHNEPAHVRVCVGEGGGMNRDKNKHLTSNVKTFVLVSFGSRSGSRSEVYLGLLALVVAVGDSSRPHKGRTLRRIRQKPKPIYQLSS